MGTMLQSFDLNLADFDQLEGCNEILNRTRPDVVRSIHDAYFEVGVDAVETNTFGTNLAALGEYGIADQIHDLAEAAARIARESADALQHDRPGPLGAGQCRPGHKAADARSRRVRRAPGCLPDPGRGDAGRRHRRGADRDLAGPAADQGRDAGRQAGARVRRARHSGHRARHRRDHRHHAAGHRDRRRADRTGAARHRPDRAELRHRPDRDERAPAAPVAVRPGRGQLHAERRAAAADRGRCALPAQAGRARRRPGAVRRASSGSGWSVAAAGPHRSTCAGWSSGWRTGPRCRVRRRTSPRPPRCTRRCRSGRTPAICRSGSAPTPTGRRPSGRPCWRSAGTTASTSPAPRSATAPTCWTSTSTTSVATVRRTCGSWPSGWPRRPPCRSCWTPPSPPCCRPAWSVSAAGR